MATFLFIFNLLVKPSASEPPFRYIGSKKSFTNLSLKDQLFLVFCKFRHAFDFKDLAFRFNVSPQDACVIFKSWVNFMYFSFSSIPIWPSRDVIQTKMPQKFRSKFPDTVAIIDSTEIFIDRPSSLKRQSQCYSEYKSHTTFKALIAVDPRGSVIFISSLFGGSVSDNEITLESGLLKLLADLVSAGRLLPGDCLMCDRGFTSLEAAVAKFGLIVNKPPSLPAGQLQLNTCDVEATKKIASSRIIVEQSIGRIKKFKILSRIPLSFCSSINQIWFLCAYLTNFLPSIVRDNK